MYTSNFEKQEELKIAERLQEAKKSRKTGISLEEFEACLQGIITNHKNNTNE